MSGGKLCLRQSFGINLGQSSVNTIKNCLTFAGEHFLAYPSGHHLAILHTETKDQQYILATHSYQHNSLGITAVAYSHNKKLIAVAEKVEPQAIVTFYDSINLRRKKLISSNEFGSNEIRCMSFSDDGKFLITQGCGPEWNLTLWNIEKSIKAIITVKISLTDECPVNQISICPWDPSVILVIGKAIFRLFRYVEGQLRPIACGTRKDHANFISHCWIPEDILILGTEGGEILLIENFEYRGLVYPTTAMISAMAATMLSGSHASESVVGNSSGGHGGSGGEHDSSTGSNPINCITATSRGFVTASLHGEFKLFERNEEIKERYSVEETFKISGNKGSIVALTVGGGEDTLVCCTDKFQMLSISLSTLTNIKDNGGSFDNFLAPFHLPNVKGEAAITGIDVALWKNIVITCGKDKTVRVWNPTDKKLELSKEFEEEPLCISVHPSGIYFAVAFPDRIRILSLLLDDIAHVREISARSVSYIKYSKGGQYLASANGTNMQIYNPMTGTLICTLRGHNNRIKSCLWMNYDSRMMTVGAEGVVYFWELFPNNGLHRRSDQFTGSVPISSGAGSADGSKVFVATSDRVLKELTFISFLPNEVIPTNSDGSVIPTKEIETPYNISNILYDESRKMLIMATNNFEDGNPGTIVCTLTSPQLSGAMDINPVHAVGITAICQSYDGNTIYTGDSNGCLFVSEFENAFSSKQNLKAREGMVSFEFVEEVVVSKNMLLNRRGSINHMTMQVNELVQNNEHQMRVRELEHKDKISEIMESYTSQFYTERAKYEVLDAERISVEKDFKKRVKNLEKKQVDELRALELKYKTKQTGEENRHRLLTEEIENAHKRWNEENHVLVSSHSKYLQELTLDYEEKFLAEQIAAKELGKQKEHLLVTYDGFKVDTELDGDKEVVEHKVRYESRLASEEQSGMELMGQHALMKKNLQMLAKDSNTQKEEIKRLKDKENRLYETIHSLEKDIHSHKKEIREREETITDKEKRIFDLKKKNQELEKFRFVLDYKIKELKLQIAPREVEIATMSKQIEEMGLEIEQYNRSNLALNLMIEELKLKLDGVRQELKHQTSRYNTNASLMSRFKRDLQEAWGRREERDQFKSLVVKMYRSYVQEDSALAASTKATAQDKKINMEDPQQVFNRDREQLERSLDSLRRCTKTDAMATKRDLGKMIREGVLLTKELNTLRKNARHLQLQKRAIAQTGALTLQTDVTELLEFLGLKTSAAPLIPEKTDENADDPTSASFLLKLPQPGAASDSSGLKKSRTAALKTARADGKLVDPASRNNGKVISSISRNDQWEAWREIQIQYDQMKDLESQLTAMCHTLGQDPDRVISVIDMKLERAAGGNGEDDFQF